MRNRISICSGSTCGNKDIFPALNLRKTHQTVPCLTGIAGLATEDFSTCDCRIRQIFKHCTVVSNSIRVDICNSGRMSGGLHNLTKRIILNAILHQNSNILNRTVMIRIMQSCRITEMSILHSKLPCFLIHQLRKIRL